MNVKKVRYSYLSEQFSDTEDLWLNLKEFVKTGDFTLGKDLIKFEENFANLIGVKYAIGVNSGTDAIKLSLKALGIKPGDEVITAANTFVATVGAIYEIGAIPVFVDADKTFCIDTKKIEQAITEKTKAIVPVHFTGYMSDMKEINQIAEKYNLIVVEDACQSILGSIHGLKAGSWGHPAAFSLHPLKNLNVWSDGGVITTDSIELKNKLHLIRNHGLKNRDEVEVLGFNSRLDTFQAVVGNWLIPQAQEISDKRISNAKYLDDGLKSIKGITIPTRDTNKRVVYHLYVVFAEHRNELLRHCLNNGIEAKIHYPIPIYLQKGLKFLNHSKGDFPITDWLADNSITFPCDQHLKKEHLDYIISNVSKFYE